MRILWVSHFVPFPPAGGALQRTYHLLRHAAARHEIHLLALNQPRLLPTLAARAEACDALSQLCASVRVIEQPAERSSIHRLATVVRSVFSDEPFDVRWMRSRELRAALSGWHSRSGIDLVHVDTIGLWPVMASWRRSPIVLGHHNVESDLATRRAGRESNPVVAALLRSDAAKLRALETQAARQVGLNVVVSRADAERLADIVPGAPIAIVDNGVDTTFLRRDTDTPPTPGTIVFAGTLGWYPNRDAVEFLLREIWPTLRAANDRRRLLLVGRDPPAMGTHDERVEVTGFVADVRSYLQRASIYVCPIRVGGGTRLKVLDALAMSLPLVATAAAVEGLELIEGIHYLRAETAGDFITAIERLERDQALQRRMREAGRSLVVERYDWTRIGR
ncbi:MAG TPA: glycosyltransferase family 4 protein, partial [Gemmatimonadaceae bacterium]|nr:glycosyltransferase family 4 protein [Gemmatimonadaceae bacterium]